MSLFPLLNKDHLAVTASCTVTNNELKNYGFFDLNTTSMTIVIPTPCQDMGDHITAWSNNVNSTQTISGTFVSGASATLTAYGIYFLMCVRVGSNWKWKFTNEVEVAINLPVKASGAEVTAGTNDAKFVTPKAASDAGLPIAGPAAGSDVTTGTNTTKWLSAKNLADAAVPYKGAAAGSDITTGTDLTKWVNAKAIADSDIPTAIATGTEVNVGTDNAKAVTAKAIADSNLKVVRFYADLSAAEAALNAGGFNCYVISLETMYRGLAAGGAYTRDGTFVLNTGDAGNTRWIGVAGKYVYNSLSVSDGTNKPVVTAAMLKGIENAAITPTDIPVLVSNTGVFKRYADLTAAELATGVDGLLCYVLSLGTLYIGLAAGGAYTRDGTYVLNTADAGNTRWIGIAGTYVYHTLNVSDGTNKAAVTATMMKGIENASISATAIPALASSTGIFRRYADLAAAELATTVDGLLSYVLSLNTLYVGIAAGGAYTRDATYVLNTADAGDTRWVGIAGQYAYLTINASDGTNKAALTPAILKGLELSAATPTDVVVKASNAGLLRIYADIAAAKAATSVDGLVGLVIANSTLYQGLAAGSAYTANDADVLITGDAGDTRWIGVAGTNVNPVINAGIVRKFADIAAAKAALGADGQIGYVASLNTAYRYLAAGSAYTADDKGVLITGDGGDTRWIAIGGAYNVVDAAWETFDPTALLTWDTATPDGMTISGKVRVRGGTAEFKVFIISADPGAAGGSLTSMAFPAGWQPADTDMHYSVVGSHLKDVGAADTPTAVVGLIDATQAVAGNRILTFFNSVVWADNEDTILSFGGSFPIA